jgi:hypothetical protein
MTAWMTVFRPLARLIARRGRSTLNTRRIYEREESILYDIINILFIKILVKS